MTEHFGIFGEFCDTPYKCQKCGCVGEVRKRDTAQAILKCPNCEHMWVIKEITGNPQ